MHISRAMHYSALKQVYSFVSKLKKASIKEEKEELVCLH